jgi:hypothetical protein
MITEHYTNVEWMQYEDFIKAQDSSKDEELDENALDATELFMIWNAQIEQENMK